MFKKKLFTFKIREQMHKSRFLSQVVEDSEPTKTQNFTDLLAELRVAQVSCIRIVNNLLLKFLDV